MTQAHANLAGMTSGEELSEQLDAKIHRLMALNHNLLQISEQNAEQNNLNNNVTGGGGGGGVSSNTGGSMPQGKLVRQVTQRRNISDDRSPQLISHLLSSSHTGDGSSSVDNTPRSPLAGNRTHHFHGEDPTRHHGHIPNNTNVVTFHTETPHPGMHDGAHPFPNMPFIMTGKPLESSDAAIAYMTPHHQQQPPSVSATPHDSHHLKSALSPEASRPSTAGGMLTSRGYSGQGFGDDPSRPDTPELMEFSRRQAAVAAQQHNVPAHLLTRPPPNAARAIMRHRAAVVGSGLGGHGGKHHRRQRVPQQVRIVVFVFKIMFLLLSVELIIIIIDCVGLVIGCIDSSQRRRL